MVKRLKIIIAVLSAIIVLLISLMAGCVYFAYHPYTSMTRSVAAGGIYANEDYHRERLMLAWSPTSHGIPMAESVRSEIYDYIYWSNSVDAELYDYVPPFDVRVYGKIENGKTNLKYEGYVTTKDGETVDFLREYTADFVFGSNGGLFDEEI